MGKIKTQSNQVVKYTSKNLCQPQSQNPKTNPPQVNTNLIQPLGKKSKPNIDPIGQKSKPNPHSWLKSNHSIHSRGQKGPNPISTHVEQKFQTQSFLLAKNPNPISTHVAKKIQTQYPPTWHKSSKPNIHPCGQKDPNPISSHVAKIQSFHTQAWLKNPSPILPRS